MATEIPKDERVAAIADGLMATASGGVACFVVLWAGILFGCQRLGWIKSGQWQPVPVGAVFLSDYGQSMLREYPARLQALDLVPALGSKVSISDAATSAGGSMLGLPRVFHWLFDIPLTLVFFWSRRLRSAFAKT